MKGAAAIGLSSTVPRREFGLPPAAWRKEVSLE
jgi:hypothetical protein